MLNMKTNSEVLRAHRKQARVGLVRVQSGIIIQTIGIGLQMRAQLRAQIGFKAGGNRGWHIQPTQQKINRQSVKPDTAAQFAAVKGQ